MGIENGCENKCYDCPFADEVYGQIAKNEAGRDDVMNAIDITIQIAAELEEQGDSPTFRALANAVGLELQDTPLGRRDSPSETEKTNFTTKIAAPAEEFFRLADEHESRSISKLKSVQSKCKTGPVIRKKYILFGEKVVACGSTESVWPCIKSLQEQ